MRPVGALPRVEKAPATKVRRSDHPDLQDAALRTLHRYYQGDDRRPCRFSCFLRRMTVIGNGRARQEALGLGLWAEIRRRGAWGREPGGEECRSNGQAREGEAEAEERPAVRVPAGEVVRPRGVEVEEPGSAAGLEAEQPGEERGEGV